MIIYIRKTPFYLKNYFRFSYHSSSDAEVVLQMKQLQVVPIETPIQEEKTEFDILASTFNVGFGSNYAYFFASELDENASIAISSVDFLMDETIDTKAQNLNIKNFDPEQFKTLQQYLSKAKYTIYWLTSNWEENWFNIEKIQKSMDVGYVPVFMYWYFGDTLVNGLDDATVQKYAADNQKLSTFLQKLTGTKLVIMEPEFNKDAIIDSLTLSTKLTQAIGSAIDTLRTDANDTYFSLCMIDKGNRSSEETYNCGYDVCALGDKPVWDKTESIYTELLPKLDFLSFKQMIAPFSRDPTNPGTWDEPNPITYTDAQLGVDYFAQRVLNLSSYLNEKYNKPVFLPYIGIGTVTWEDINTNTTVDDGEVDLDGWEPKLVEIYRELSLLQDDLLSAGMFGYAPMTLFDNPQHDIVNGIKGYQYFLDNEYHLGIMKSGALDEVDLYIHGDIAPKGGDDSLLDYIFGAL